MNDTWTVTIKNTATGFAVSARIVKNPTTGGTEEHAVNREYPTVVEAFQAARQWIQNAVTP